MILLRSLSSSLKVSEVGRSDLHLSKLNGVLVTLPVEPVHTLEKKKKIIGVNFTSKLIKGVTNKIHLKKNTFLCRFILHMS